MANSINPETKKYLKMALEINKVNPGYFMKFLSRPNLFKKGAEQCLNSKQF